MPPKKNLAPDFTLPDVTGNQITLSTFRGKRNILLVLNRGFACPFCRQHLAELRRGIDGLAARHTDVLVIAPEYPEAVSAFWQREQFPFFGFADPDHSVAALYHQEANMFRTGRLPAEFLMDRSGAIQYSHFGTTPADIPPLSEIFDVLDSLGS
jgi:peroxiredoxin